MRTTAVTPPTPHDLRRSPRPPGALLGAPLGHQHGHGATSHPSHRVHGEERSVVRSRRPMNLRPSEPVLRIRASGPSPRRRRRVEPQGEAECIPLAKGSNTGRKTAKAYRQTGEVGDPGALLMHAFRGHLDGRVSHLTIGMPTYKQCRRTSTYRAKGVGSS
jgi:hypothetical protein